MSLFEGTVTTVGRGTFKEVTIRLIEIIWDSIDGKYTEGMVSKECSSIDHLNNWSKKFDINVINYDEIQSKYSIEKNNK